ncbi:hypothetical protein ACFLYH_00770 [Candidatus Dependentiae bacterium]
MKNLKKIILSISIFAISNLPLHIFALEDPFQEKPTNCEKLTYLEKIKKEVSLSILKNEHMKFLGNGYLDFFSHENVLERIKNKVNLSLFDDKTKNLYIDIVSRSINKCSIEISLKNWSKDFNLDLIDPNNHLKTNKKIKLFYKELYIEILNKFLTQNSYAINYKTSLFIKNNKQKLVKFTIAYGFCENKSQAINMFDEFCNKFSKEKIYTNKKQFRKPKNLINKKFKNFSIKKLPIKLK